MENEGMIDYRYARRAEILGKSIYDHAPGAIVLNSGLAYPPLLPDVAREAEIASGRAKETMQYGPLMGLDDLRDQIVRYVAADGISCKRENVLVTNGAKHALDLACRVFVEPGDRVIVTRPTYMTALINMRTHGVTFLEIPQDREGIDCEFLEAELARLANCGERMPKLLFDVPDFHNPTGITMSLGRRRRLLGMAKRYGFVICEDDPYRRIRFEGEPISPLKALDEHGVVIALGTVSKILSPGLRTGWAIAPAEVAERMSMQKSEGGSSPFLQRVVAELMRSNRMSEHIEAVASRMRIHRDTMVASLARELPDAEVRAPSGGYFLWARLPEGVSAENVAARACEQGVEVSPGGMSFPGSDPGNYLRFAYSYPGPDEIREGIRRLGRAFRAEARKD
ncbi:MAG: PLP-dependent aminotransferase family protein [Albidovulum sp.]|nr:PLP-dependent aminotransferase family protein [Albidovulum sp.]MDE0534168.1 PLP-dependent aminotransferase family protein [Albidovulum sp.]